MGGTESDANVEEKHQLRGTETPKNQEDRMDVQNRDRVYAQEIVPWTWGAFAEPRGWALKWVFTQQMAYHSVEQRPRDGKVPWNKFAESRAWACLLYTSPSPRD